MRPDQSLAAKRMDLSDLPLELRAQILQFVKGIRGPRDLGQRELPRASWRHSTK